MSRGPSPVLQYVRGRIQAIHRERVDRGNLRALLASALTRDSNCIDIGCHAGAVLREFVRFAPAGRHIAYEPLPAFHERLRREFPQVDVRRVALSDRTGEADFTYVKSRPGYSGLRQRSYPGSEQLETIRVRVEPLDLSLPADYAPTLIKIDVEGAEREVIEGGIRTIEVHRPIVVFEHGRGAADHYGTGPDDIFELLCRQAGLRLFDLDGKGPLSRRAFAHAFERGAIWNFVARP